MVGDSLAWSFLMGDLDSDLTVELPNETVEVA